MNGLRRWIGLLIPAVAVALGGCASSMNGLGGEASYACRAPAGAQCTSVSGVYANSIHGLPSGLQLPQPAAAPTPAPIPAAVTHAPTFEAAPATAVATAVAPPTASIRSQARVLRLWIAPWEDADGDLHEASVVHVLVDTGRWLIERVRPAQRNRIDTVRPPAPSAPSAPPAATPAQQGAPTSPAEPGPDRFPPRTGLPPGNGAAQEP